MAAGQHAQVSENEALLLDLLEWVARRPRPRAELLEAWGTSCPRFPVWEAAIDLRFLARQCHPGAGETIEITAGGREFLRAHGRRA